LEDAAVIVTVVPLTEQAAATAGALCAVTTQMGVLV
jgi:hypothetical protein